MLRVRLHVGHECFHALFKHGSVGQGHGFELWQNVHCVFLEIHLLQGALQRPQRHCPWQLSPLPITVPIKPKAKPIAIKKKSENEISCSNPDLVRQYGNMGSLLLSCDPGLSPEVPP